LSSGGSNNAKALGLDAQAFWGEWRKLATQSNKENPDGTQIKLN